jgi:hypothetical protein
MDPIIQANKFEDIMVDDIMLLNWRWSLVQFFDHKDEVAIQEAMKGHRETHNYEFDASTLFKQIKKINPYWTTLDVLVSHCHNRHHLCRSVCAVLLLEKGLLQQKVCQQHHYGSVGTTSAT